MDPGPFPLQAARSLGRWLWPTLAVSGFLAVVAYTFAHDPSAPGLSSRGLLTVALAAVVVVLLTIHRRHGPGPLARAVAEYAAVALLASLLTAPGVGIDQQPADHPGQRPGPGPGRRRRRPARRDPGRDQGASGRRRADPGRHWRGPLAGQPVAPSQPAGRAHQQRGDCRPAPLPKPVCPLDLEVPRLMWSSLPSNLRTVLGTALLLGLGVAAAAFTLSFFALRDAAQDPALAWGSGHAWLFPIGVDMALVFFEVLLLGASMVRIHDHGQVIQYPRAIPFLLMLVAAAGTLYFNATHVPTPVRPLALAVPVASILVTLGLAYLLKMLAAASGAAAIHLAPPATGAQPHRPQRATCCMASSSATPRSPAPTSCSRPTRSMGRCPAGRLRNTAKTGSRRWPATAQLPEATKRHQVEAYLAALGPDQLGRLTTLGPRAAARELTGTLNGQGMQVSERYVQQILDDWTAATRQPANGRRRTR